MASNTAEYRTLQSLTNELSLAVKQDLTGVCGALFADGLITQGIREQLGNALHPKEDRAAQLIGIIQDKVREGPRNYQIFISVLEKRDMTHYGDILRMLQGTYKDLLSHPESGHRHFYRLTSTGSSSAGGSFERDQPPDESAKENGSEEDMLNERNLESIKDQFAVLLRRFREAFNGVDVNQVHQYLTDILQREIPYPSDIQSFFSYLSSKKFWTYYHFSLVERLDKHFLRHSEKSIQQHISDYKRQLSGFFVAKNIISSEFFTDSTSSESTTDSVADYTREHHRVLKMRLELKRNVSEESLQYVADLWESLAIEFELPSLTAVIDSIVKKCLEITWLIFPSDAEKIVATAARHTDFFEKYAITLLTIDGIIIYQKESPAAADRNVQGPVEEIPDPCLNYSLFGECRFGARCRHQHIRSTSSPVTVHVQVKHLKYPPTRYFNYKERNPTSHKGFIILQSENEPTNEIKLVAEDQETAEYAQHRLPDITPAKKNVKRECIEKKLFGKCRNKTCAYKHGGVVKEIERPKVDYFCHPMGIWRSLKSVIGFKEYTDDDQAYKVVQSDRDPNREVKVIAESEEALEYARRRLTVILGRQYAEKYVTRCYIHPEDLRDLNGCLLFQRQPSKEQEYTIMKVPSDVSDQPSKSIDDDFLASLCRKNQHSKPVSEILDNPQSIPRSFSSQMRFDHELSDAIHANLQSALQWISKQQLQLKLRGRFGKLTFSKNDKKFCDPEGCDATEIIKYLFDNTRYKRFFNIKMPEEASSALATSSLIDAGSTVETYELKLGIRDTDRLEVHLRFLEGRAEPEVIQLKKDDSRILTVDVMCLNHKYDLRLDLSTFKIIPADDRTILDFLSKMEMTPQRTISLVPVGPDRDWVMTIIRHKVKRAFYLKDSGMRKYLVTICSVREYKAKEGDLKPSDPIEVNMDRMKEETEIEFHNLDLDVQIGKQFGQSPVECLALLLEPNKVPSEFKSLAVSGQHSTEMIMKEFVGGKFLQSMNNLNDSL